MLTEHESLTIEKLGCGALALHPGHRFAQVEIQQVIGEGGFSIVYQAFDHRQQRCVAVKEYLPTTIATRNSDGLVVPRNPFLLATFNAGRNYFRQEATILTSLSHPAVPQCFDFWQENGTAYISMPLYGGKTLKKEYAENPAIVSEAWLRRLLASLLNTLAAVHRQGCLHRDISWDNIQIEENHPPILLDFGSACFRAAGCPQKPNLVLKPGFSPAELYYNTGGYAHGPWSDIYSLGALMYTLITGHVPPVGLTRCIADTYQPLAQCQPAGYSPPFLRAIDAALGVNPVDRPQDIAAFARLLAGTP
ncbi:serine/threonine protein kinase [Chania multitudinisentens]|uniref:serine/threonine protein kinase n=1 Tax=Chania multitudinisentens TaxID=1639108 RepID=UPI000464B43A|nr:serine/threonine-protein kinase [Chania multitudinisentens]